MSFHVFFCLSNALGQKRRVLELWWKNRTLTGNCNNFILVALINERAPCYSVNYWYFINTAIYGCRHFSVASDSWNVHNGTHTLFLNVHMRMVLVFYATYVYASGMGSSRTVLDLKDGSRTKNRSLGLKEVWPWPWPGRPLVLALTLTPWPLPQSLTCN